MFSGVVDGIIVTRVQNLIFESDFCIICTICFGNECLIVDEARSNVVTHGARGNLRWMVVVRGRIFGIGDIVVVPRFHFAFRILFGNLRIYHGLCIALV